MEEKNLTEKESIELISRMIKQTRRTSVLASGDLFLLWGYLSVIGILVTCATIYFTQEHLWGYLYSIIPIVGGIGTWFLQRRIKKTEDKVPITYTTKNINSIWECLSGVIGAYAIYCLFHLERPASWEGFFILTMIMTAIGSYITGVILEDQIIKIFGMIITFVGIFVLHDLFYEDFDIIFELPLATAFCLIFTLIIPGHVLNFRLRQSLLEQTEE